MDSTIPRAPVASGIPLARRGDDAALGGDDADVAANTAPFAALLSGF